MRAPAPSMACLTQWEHAQTQLDDEEYNGLPAFQGFAPSQFNNLPYRSPETSVAAPKRPRYPSAQDWDGIRPIFTELYSVQKKPLKEVKDIFERDHGFVATKRMYMKRINDWKLRKNLKNHEKKILVGQWRQAGGSNPPVFHGRPVEMHRLLRYCKENDVASGHQEIAIPRKWQRPSGYPIYANNWVESSSQGLQPIFQSPAEPARPITLSGDMRTAEFIIWNIQHYLKSYFTSGPGNQYFEVDSTAQSPVLVKNEAAWKDVVKSSSMRRHVARAFRALQHGFVKLAFEEINKGCTLMKVVLEQQPPALLASLFAILIEYTREDSRLARNTREFILEMARAALGDAHPLTRIVTQLCMLSSVAEKCFVWGAATDAVQKEFGILEDSKPLRQTQWRYFKGLQHLGLINEAQTYLGAGILKDEERKENNTAYIFLMVELLSYQGKFVEAEIQCRRCLELLKEVEYEILVKKTEPSFSGGRRQIMGSRYFLANLLESTERIDEAKAMWWQVLDFTSAVRGPDSLKARIYASEFDGFLTRHGFEEGRAALRAQYPCPLLPTKLPPESL